MNRSTIFFKWAVLTGVIMSIVQVLLLYAFQTPFIYGIYAFIMLGIGLFIYDLNKKQPDTSSFLSIVLGTLAGLLAAVIAGITYYLVLEFISPGLKLTLADTAERRQELAADGIPKEMIDEVILEMSEIISVKSQVLANIAIETLLAFVIAFLLTFVFKNLRKEPA